MTVTETFSIPGQGIVLLPELKPVREERFNGGNRFGSSDAMAGRIWSHRRPQLPEGIGRKVQAGGDVEWKRKGIRAAWLRDLVRPGVGLAVISDE